MNTYDEDPNSPGSEEAQPAPDTQREEDGAEKGETDADADDLADEMSKQSFPTSDPPSTWAGGDRDQSEPPD